MLRPTGRNCPKLPAQLSGQFVQPRTVELDHPTRVATEALCKRPMNFCLKNPAVSSSAARDLPGLRGGVQYRRFTTAPTTCAKSSQAGASRLLAAAAQAKGPVVVIDNYDSFTYNICQYLGELGADFVVFKNDEKTVDEIRAMNPAGILVSPGPGAPSDSGICLQAVRELGPDFPLFGVCMGHQCIGEAFGGDVVRAPCGVMHGKTSPVYHTNVGVLEGLENPFLAARYHSLLVAKDTCPEDLEVTAWTEDGSIMAMVHKKYPHIQGVQFHPESIITQNGKRIIGNWVKAVQQQQQHDTHADHPSTAVPVASVVTC